MLKQGGYHQDSNSFIDPFISVSKLNQLHGQAYDNSNEKYKLRTNEFDTFNAKSSKNNPEKSKKKKKLNEVINQNLNLNSFRSMSKDRYGNMMSQNSYEVEQRVDTNHSVPLIPLQNNLCNMTAGFSREVPNWATGVQQMPNYEPQMRSSVNNRSSESVNDGTINHIMLKLSQLEHRIHSTEENMRISREIADLKYGEKKLAQDIGKFK